MRRVGNREIVVRDPRQAGPDYHLRHAAESQEEFVGLLFNIKDGPAHIKRLVSAHGHRHTHLGLWHLPEEDLKLLRKLEHLVRVDLVDHPSLHVLLHLAHVGDVAMALVAQVALDLNIGSPVGKGNAQVNLALAHGVNLA